MKKTIGIYLVGLMAAVSQAESLQSYDFSSMADGTSLIDAGFSTNAAFTNVVGQGGFQLAGTGNLISTIDAAVLGDGKTLTSGQYTLTAVIKNWDLTSEGGDGFYIGFSSDTETFVGVGLQWNQDGTLKFGRSQDDWATKGFSANTPNGMVDTVTITMDIDLDSDTFSGSTSGLGDLVINGTYTGGINKIALGKRGGALLAGTTAVLESLTLEGVIPEEVETGAIIRFGGRSEDDSSTVDRRIWWDNDYRAVADGHTDDTDLVNGDNAGFVDAVAGDSAIEDTDPAEGSGLVMTFEGASRAVSVGTGTAAKNISINGSAAGWSAGDYMTVSFNKDVRLVGFQVPLNAGTWIVTSGGETNGVADAVQTYEFGPDTTVTAGTDVTFAAGSGVSGCYFRTLTVEVLVASVPEGFEGWVESYGLTGAANVGANDDYNGNGIANIVEYSMGASLTNGSDLGHEPVFRLNGTDLEYVYARRTTAGNGLSYELEVSPSLISPVWTNIGYTTLPAEVIDDNFEAITNLVPVDVSAKFIRLNISN